MTQPAFPSLYQLNTRVLLFERSQSLGRQATLDDFTDAEMDAWAELGFHWIWLLGVWQTGEAGRQVSLGCAAWQPEYRSVLPDFTPADVCGSPFAITSYSLHADFGPADSLTRLRQRLAKRGLRLMLDFVPNHTAIDHPWASQHPEYYIAGDEAALAKEPGNYLRVGNRILAHGRDPYFPGWPDTLQLNYRHGGFRQAMTAELARVAGCCDGVRCDMAMLLLTEVFKRTWGKLSDPRDGSPAVDVSFWPEAIRAARQANPGFTLMAEVYWDLEHQLQQEGFDYTYDKRLYDRLHGGEIEGVRRHLWADLHFQRKSVRFLENHDEPRANATFPGARQAAAAVATYLTPGLRFFHEGQMEGRRIKASLHLRRRPQEAILPEIGEFYRRLLECLKRPELHSGNWKLLSCAQAWEGNPTHEAFLAYTWTAPGRPRILAAVNCGSTQGQCRIALSFEDVKGRQFQVKDLLSSARYERDGKELYEQGLFLDMPAWGYHVFEMRDL